MKLLFVEDDPILGKSLERWFVEAGHECQREARGDDGLTRAMSMQADCIVLDVMLPGLGGLEVLRQMRAAGNRTPVILLTALGSVEERVAGLDAGADDYMVKPFAMSELASRIQAILRRSMNRPSTVLQAGELELDLATRRVNRGASEIELTPTEFSLLELLMRYAGQVVTRKMLCEHLWESDWEGTTNVIEVHINRIRGKLDRGAKEPLIQTVRGRGYALRASGETPGK